MELQVPPPTTISDALVEADLAALEAVARAVADRYRPNSRDADVIEYADSLQGELVEALVDGDTTRTAAVHLLQAAIMAG